MNANVAKAGNHSQHPRWWQISSDDELANELCGITDGLESDDGPRCSRYLANLQLYELRALNGLNANGYYTTSDAQGVTLPVLRSICDTVQADIAGRQRPLPMFQTTGADWATRRRAKKLGKFVEAVLHQPQGTYVNGWELAVDIFLDCEIFGVGIMHVYVDELTDKVVLARVAPEELHVDPREAENGDPLNWFRSYLVDEDKVLAEFLPQDGKRDDDDTKRETEQKRALMRAAIESAATTDNAITPGLYGYTRIARSVKIREAFRLPLSEDEPGLHAYAIPGKLLHKEDWTRDHPYVFFLWSRPRRGFWPVSLVDEAKLLAEELNGWFESCQERVKLCANRRTFVPRGSNIDESDMEANESESIIYFDGLVAPVVSEVPALNPADFKYGELVKSLCYEMPGVSQMSAQGRKEPGVTSGVAIRTVQDLATKRFAVKARYAYEYPFVSLARKIVAAIAEYVEATGRDITVRLPQKRGMREFKWADVKLDGDFDITITPASSLPSDPAGRLSTIQELFNAQVISAQTFKRLLDWPDLDQEMNRDRSEWEYVEELIERFLDATAKNDVKVEGADDFLLYPEDALLQVSAAYFEAKRDQAPAVNLQLLRDYMLELGKLIDARNAPPEAPAQAPPGAPDAAMAGLAAPSPAGLGPGAPPLPPPGLAPGMAPPIAA